MEGCREVGWGGEGSMVVIVLTLFLGGERV